MRWKSADLPPLKHKEPLVRHKLYLTREQTLTVKRLSGEEKQPVSGYLRKVVAEFLSHYNTETE